MPVTDTLVAGVDSSTQSCKVVIREAATGTLVRSGRASHPDGTVPYFVGERTPNLPGATASLHGMTPLTTSRPHLARAAIEGMLCALADGLAAVELIGVPVRRLLLTGGAAQNPAVRLAAAQVFGRDIAVPEPGEYVAAGAAMTRPG